MRTSSLKTRGPRKEKAREDQHAPQHEEAQVEVAHENGELEQDAQAVHRDGGGHGSHHRKGRQLHHVAGDLEHGVREFVDGGHQRLGLVAERGERHAEEHREHHDLQDLVVGHRLGKGLRNHVAHEVLERELRSGQIGRRADVRQRKPQVLAGLQEIGHDEADDQRDQRCREKPAERLAEHAAHRLGIAHVRDAYHQGGEHQRPDQHLDETQEHVRHDRDVARDLRGCLLVGEAREDHVADENAEHHGNQDPGGGRQFLSHVCPFEVCVVLGRERIGRHPLLVRQAEGIQEGPLRATGTGAAAMKS
jgi:hypothetical protein